MSWVNVGIIAATTLMSANKAKRQGEAQDRQNALAAETTRYSPWTGQMGQVDTSYVPSTMEGGLQGALTGVSAVQGMKSGGEAKPAPAPENSSEYANIFGGDDYAKKLGQWGSLDYELNKPTFFANN